MGMITAFCPLCHIITNIEVSTRYFAKIKFTNFRCLKCGKTIKTDKEEKEARI